MQNIDIAIIGGGIIGLTIACGLHGNGLRVAVLEKALPHVTIKTDKSSELRVSAINAASERLLVRLGVWSEIDNRQASCFHSVEIWDKDSFRHTIFDSKSIGYNCLGYVIKNAVIRQALWHKVQRCCDTVLIAPTSIQEILWREDDVFIILQDGESLTARLVIGADGTNSWLRNKSNISSTWWNYRHHALIATVHTVKPHNAVARQVFHSDSILAFLPLNDLHLCSIVWSMPPDKAKQMQSAEPEVFNQTLCVAFDNHLGLCSVKSERQVFPLIGRYVHQFAGHRLVLVGDAAHTVHPLAGQGVNLGFMDSADLIAEIHRLHLEGSDIGQYSNLRCYERRRKQKTAFMLAGMQGFYELFSGTNLSKKLVRNIGFKFVNTFPGIKRKFLYKAMGLYDLPDWLL